MHDVPASVDDELLKVAGHVEPVQRVPHEHGLVADDVERLVLRARDLPLQKLKPAINTVQTPISFFLGGLIHCCLKKKKIQIYKRCPFFLITKGVEPKLELSMVSVNNIKK